MSRAGRGRGGYEGSAPAPFPVSGLSRPTLDGADLEIGTSQAAAAGVPSSIAGPGTSRLATVSIAKATGTVANGAGESLDLYDDLKGLVPFLRTDRYAIVGVSGHKSGTGTGPWILDAWRCQGRDLGQSIVVGNGNILSLWIPLPPSWLGELQVQALNRSNASGILFTTLWIGSL